MSGHGAFEEIKKNAERSGGELKLTIDQGQLQRSQTYAAPRLSGLPEAPDAVSFAEKNPELIREEAVHSVQERLGSPELSIPEGQVIKQAEGIVDEDAKGIDEVIEAHDTVQVIPQSVIKKEQAIQSVEKKLDLSYAHEEGKIIRKSRDDESDQEQKKASDEAKRRERAEAIRKAFRKYGALIVSDDTGNKNDDVWSLIKERSKDPKKDSIYYRQLREACEGIRELARRMDDASLDEPDTNELLQAMMRLSETARIYYDTHRGRQYTDRGKNRKDAVRKIKDLTEHFYDDMGVMQSGEGMLDRRAFRSLKNADGVKAEKRLKELVGNYEKWKKHFAFQEADERANIKAKAELFAVYEPEMDIYRSLFRNNPDGMDPDIAAIMKEARYYKIQNRVLQDFEKTGEMENDAVAELSKEHADAMDYREKSEEELTSEEIDRDISPSQLAAIERVDRWFLRNYNNGGIVGRPLNIRNHHGEIVSALMSRTRRERLFIYYLIETGARKDPKVYDAYASQTEYTPDLDKLKKQMLASKLKLMSRIMGGYVYMHKLSEALQVNREYKELIKDSARLTRKEREKAGDPKINDPIELRSRLLKQAYLSSKDYKEKAEKCRKAKGSAKAALEAEVIQAKERFKNDIKALVDADKAVGENAGYGDIKEEGQKNVTGLHNRTNGNIGDAISNTATYASAGTNAGAYLGMGLNTGAATADVVLKKSGGLEWRLEGSDLANVDKYAKGYTASTITGLGHVMAVLYGIYNLYENGAKMHAGDIGKEIASILKSGASTYISYRTGVELVDKYGKLAKNFDQTKTVQVSNSLKTAGMITSGAGVLLNAYDSLSGALDCRNANSAAKYLSTKFERSEALKNAPEGETLEQKNKRLGKLKEIRYEKNILKLSAEISKHKTKYAGLQTTASAIGFGSVFVPGIGTAIVSVGGMAFGITMSILDAVNMGDIRTKLFDTYFDFEGYLSKVGSSKAADGRNIYNEKQYKDRMRRKLAAAAGFSDMVSAADQIAKRYADQVCSRLFGGGEEMPEEEKKAYIQMIKSFGLPYDEEKGIPDAKLLTRKMTGR